MKHTIILGAGLTGLSTAYHLQHGYDIFEQEADAGGLCRTMERDGFLFDYTGHLLHLRQDATRELVRKLLPGAYQEHTRKALIYTRGRYIEYPFQANISGLAPQIVKECLVGFLATLQDSPVPSSTLPLSFHDWVLRTFGAGVAKYFMFPYNQKLWRIPLEQLAADWVSWSIPKPTLDEFLNGALGIQNQAFGYNPTFLYPKQGGIAQLPQALLANIPAERVHFCKQAVGIDPQTRTVRFNDGSCRRYDTLISTMPLKRLIAQLDNEPDNVRAAAERLRYISVYNLNVGVRRPHISDAHWLYFPESHYPFYRVGFPTNFSDSVAPPRCSSMYIEISALPDEQLSEQTLRKQALDGLRRSGILRETDDIPVADLTRIECAYIIHDLHRARALQTIFPYLEAQRIYSIGRYGAWKYDSMEDALLDGQQAAQRVTAEMT